ncbi:cytochrome P450 [Fomitopsis serialis]|uniref:cytochrome P450 n=1 Tax=Fomitopsis serialis TaxID=139415 RepID=UPI0020078218|nr:cytochrome P450 [Neoantrodia serialis]KAH9929336.1 cytochrome P450 [Neoantrodia serialis]
MSQDPIPYAWLAIPALCILLYSLSRSSQGNRHLPPGPKRLPLVGNVFDLPSQYPWQFFASWAQKYGDLMYTETFGHRTIIINSQKIARDLLEKRGAKYSSRPRMALLVELSEGHRKQRRWIWSAFGEKKAVQNYRDLRERETYTLLLGLMERPDDFALHIKRHVAALVLESVYGHRITSLEDEYVTLMDNAMDATTATGVAGGTAVDIFPILQHVPAWIPGVAFKRVGLHARQLVWKGHHVPYRMVREAMVSGDARPSFASALTEKAQKAGRLAQEENDIRYAAGNIYGAMVLHPKVYRRAQEEVDRVVGNNRLPTSEDRPRLPYIEAVLKETYRSICRDERIWGDPAAFRPERFLEPKSEVLDPFNVVFGYGRRICPGRLFADTMLFLAIANMAATLDIRKARDAEGKEITPEASFTPNFISHAEEFKCFIAPRSSAAKARVAETLARVPA